MKSIIWFLSSLMLLQSSGIGVNDIIQVDYLIEHAQYHQQTYGDNLWVFISKHYGELKKDHLGGAHKDGKGHNDLPFGHHCCNHGSVVALLMDFPGYDLDKKEIFNKASISVIYKEPFANLFVSRFFQPPRVA